MPPEPCLTRGGIAVDDRGHLAYVTGLDLSQIRRLYIVANHRPGFIRAWHGHQHEHKQIMVTAGSAIVAAVPIDDWQQPSRDLPIHRWILSEHRPAVLHIPAGHANGIKTLTPGARILILSTASLEESQADDWRWPPRYWDPWKVTER